MRAQFPFLPIPGLDDSRHSSVGIANEICNSGRLFHAGSCIACPLQKEIVQYRSANCQPLIAVSAETVLSTELPMYCRAVRSVDAHSVQLRRTGFLDGRQCIHLGKYPRCLRAQVLGACLVAGKSRTIDDENIDAASSEKECGRGTCRTSADDNYLRVRHWRGSDCCAPHAQPAGILPCTASVGAGVEVLRQRASAMAAAPTGNPRRT